MIDALFTDKKFIQLESRVQLVVLYFASISEADINYNQLENHKRVLIDIYKLIDHCDSTLAVIHNWIIDDLKKHKFQLKLSQIKFVPPTNELAYSYVIDNMDKLKDLKSIKDIKADINTFINYYASVDWKVGKKKEMSNWKAALIKWLNNDWNKSGVKKSETERSFATFMKLQNQGQ